MPSPGVNKKVPPINEPTWAPSAVLAVLKQLKAAIEVLSGQRGNVIDRAVTFADMLAVGLMSPAAVDSFTVGYDLSGFERKAEKDQPNGYAGLDGGGYLKVAEMPPSIAVTPLTPGVVVSTGTVLTNGTISAGLTYDVGTHTLANTGVLAVAQGTISASGVLTLGPNMALSGGTVDLAGVINVGTSLVVGSAVTLSSAGGIFTGTTLKVGSTIDVEITSHKDVVSGYAGLDSNAKVPFLHLQSTVQKSPFGVFHPGVMTNNELILMVPISVDTIIPAGWAGLMIEFNGTSVLPAGTLTWTVDSGITGTWTNRGTISINTGGSLSVSSAPTADVTITAPGALRFVGQATADTQAADFVFGGYTLKVPG